MTFVGSEPGAPFTALFSALRRTSIHSWLCWHAARALLIHDISIEMTSIQSILHHGKEGSTLAKDHLWGKYDFGILQASEAIFLSF